MRERSDTTSTPERYIRINIAKNTKGYTSETTVSTRWVDDDFHEYDDLEELLRCADDVARAEIARRAALDGGNA